MSFPESILTPKIIPNAINGIVKYGYILPGDIHPMYGYTFMMNNGNIYVDGVGCYSVT